MRFIYLSTTKENDLFGNWNDALDFFKDYLSDSEKYFNISERKISKEKFDVGEDVFFVLPWLEYGYYTYIIIAYAKAGSSIENTGEEQYPYCFEINADTLKIFPNGIDIQYFQNFIDDDKQGLSKRITLSGNIKSNKFTGSISWAHFESDDSKKIMDWFKEVVLSENVGYIAKW